MSELTSDQLAELKDKLQQRQALLVRELRAHAAEGAGKHYAEMSGNVADEGDDSVADLLIDLELQAMDRDVLELQQIQQTYLRINDGSYGTCEDCGNDIPFERLAANPTSYRCIACQTQREKVYAHENRPTL